MNQSPSEPTSAASEPAKCPVHSKWLRRLGAGAFLFFFIKGLLWLIVPAVIALVSLR